MRRMEGKRAVAATLYCMLIMAAAAGDRVIPRVL
jgi:hypothetical protein